MGREQRFQRWISLWFLLGKFLLLHKIYWFCCCWWCCEYGLNMDGKSDHSRWTRKTEIWFFFCFNFRNIGWIEHGEFWFEFNLMNSTAVLFFDWVWYALAGMVEYRTVQLENIIYWLSAFTASNIYDSCLEYHISHFDSSQLGTNPKW